uniref:Protein-tyrosine-phosphatase n=2 Tax=Mesocestoides corti TaxID=53468 RepID=A0A5K3FVM8_MESCO
RTLERVLIVLAKPVNIVLIIVGVVLALAVLVVVLFFVLQPRRRANRNHSPSEYLEAASKDRSDFTIAYHDSNGPIEFSSPQPTPVDFANISRVTSRLDDENGWSYLFELLKTLADEQERAAQLTQNAGSSQFNLNRYVDMLPYDQSMVILGRKWSVLLKNPRPTVVSGPLSSSYINASYVRPPNYTATGAAVASSQDTQPEYIAAQGPLPHTVADFLTIIYEQRCPHIVMLCNIEENSSPKCARYWPAQATETFVSDGRSVIVTKVGEQITPNFTYREFTILPSDEKEPWPVKQIHFTLWNDYGAPPVEQIYAVILKHLSFLEQTPIGSYGPPLVHCSAGVGRTGTFICARYILERLRKDASTIDVFGTALAVRRWRKSLVQTAVQLNFLYLFAEYCIAREGIQPVARKPQ